jgi:hypothetical protein
MFISYYRRLHKVDLMTSVSLETIKRYFMVTGDLTSLYFLFLCYHGNWLVVDPDHSLLYNNNHTCKCDCFCYKEGSATDIYIKVYPHFELSESTNFLSMHLIWCQLQNKLHK